MDKENYYKELIVKHLTGTATENETAELFKWVDAHKSNRKEFIQFKAFWIESQASLHKKENISDTAFKEFEAWTQEKNSQISINQTSKKKYLRVIGYAASIIIAVSFLAAGYFLGTKSILPQKEQLTEIEAPIGGKSKILLPDGTNVWLNAGSKLTYSSNFNNEDRNVELDGEAYFDVVKNKELPFIVNTSHLDLRVLGTSFNVRSYADDSQISTTLVEGEIAVELNDKHTREIVTLKPNQSLVYYKNERDRKIISEIKQDDNLKFSDKLEKLQPKIISDELVIHEKADIEGEVTWKDGRLVLTEEPLINLARKLEREYQVNVHFVDPELKMFSYSGTLLLDFPIEQIMNVIQQVSEVDYTINGQDIKLYSAK